MNRAQLQRLSSERLADAQVLFAANQWSGSYYLAGYSLECALKSCVLAYIERTGVIFEDKKYAEKCWTHNIEELVKQSGLIAERDLAMASNGNLALNWFVASDWKESSRYALFTQLQAQELLDAIGHPTDGVLPWLKTFW